MTTHDVSRPRAQGLPPELARLLGYLRQDPDNRKLREDAFDLALASGHWDVAEEQTTRMLGRSPVDFGWRHRLALLDMAQQQWDEAAFILQSLLDEGQNDPAVSYNLAYVAYARGDYSGAVDRLLPLLKTAGEPRQLSLALRCLHHARRLDEGLQLFGEYAGLIPGAESAGVASLIAVDADRLALASQWAEKALREDTQQHEALVALGSAKLAEREGKAALQLLTLARKGHPNDGRTLSALGLAYLLELDLAASHEAFTAAVAVMPEHIGTWHGLGWCEIARRDIPAAGRAFEKALQLDRTFAESHGGLAVIQAYQNRRDEASASIDRALRLDSGSLSARYAQALLSGDAKDPEKFSRFAQRVLGSRRDATGRSLADVVLRTRPDSPAHTKA